MSKKIGIGALSLAPILIVGLGLFAYIIWVLFR